MDQAGDEPDPHGRESVDPGLEIFPIGHSAIRRSIKSTNVGFNSTPTQLRPSSADTGWELSAEVVFLNPCHGEEYDGVGGHISGPAPRGLDRFAVLVKGGEVIVDVAAFEYGPDR